MTFDLLSQAVPRSHSREGRVELVLQCAQAILEGRPVPREAALLVGTALSKWLEAGGNLERDHLRVAAPAGSHRTPAAIAEKITSSRGATVDDDGSKFDP